MKNNFQRIFLIVCSAAQIFTAPMLFAQDDSTSVPNTEETSSEVAEREAKERQQQEWLETLNFGIESEVTKSIDAMIEAKDYALSEQVAMLFGSDRVNLRSKVLDYFEAFAEPRLIDAILKELRNYHDLPSNDFIVRLINHLKELEHSINNELWEIFQEMISERGNSVQSAVVKYIGSSKFTGAGESLRELYSESNPILQESILIALGEIGDADSKGFVFETAENEGLSTSIRMAAITAAGAYGTDDAFALLKETYQSSENLLRLASVEALRNFSIDKRQNFYLDVLRDSNWRVRLEALEAIEESPFPQAISALKYMSLKDPEQNIREQAIASIAALNNEDGWAFLRETLGPKTDSDPTAFVSINIRRIAAGLLIQNDFDASRDVLKETMLAEWEVRNSALLDTIAKTLSEAELPQAEEFYSTMLDHPNFIIQIYGIRGIELNNIQSLRDRVKSIAENPRSHRSLKSIAESALESL